MLASFGFAEDRFENFEILGALRPLEFVFAQIRSHVAATPTGEGSDMFDHRCCKGSILTIQGEAITKLATLLCPPEYLSFGLSFRC